MPDDRKRHVVVCHLFQYPEMVDDGNGDAVMFHGWRRFDGTGFLWMKQQTDTGMGKRNG